MLMVAALISSRPRWGGGDDDSFFAFGVVCVVARLRKASSSAMTSIVERTFTCLTGVLFAGFSVSRNSMSGSAAGETVSIGGSSARRPLRSSPRYSIASDQ